MADMTENKAAVGKYSSSVNEAALAGLAKTYALVLSKKDTQYVACSDSKERDTVRANFLQKKLGLTNAEAELDAAVLAVCEKMKAEKFKSRLVAYYLLAEKFGKLGVFVK